MNTIRTTISLNENIYDQMRLLAATQRTSLSKIINRHLSFPTTLSTITDTSNKKSDIRTFFRRLNTSSPNLNSVTAIRNMRDDRLEQLSSR